MTNTLITAAAIFVIIITFIQWGLTHAYVHSII